MKLSIFVNGENGCELERRLLQMSADIVERVDPIFYGDPLTAARKVLELKMIMEVLISGSCCIRDYGMEL